MYKVTTKFYDTGKVEAGYSKPEDKPGEFSTYDCYVDEFRTKAEAQEFIAEAQSA